MERLGSWERIEKSIAKYEERQEVYSGLQCIGTVYAKLSRLWHSETVVRRHRDLRSWPRIEVRLGNSESV